MEWEEEELREGQSQNMFHGLEEQAAHRSQDRLFHVPLFGNTDQDRFSHFSLLSFQVISAFDFHSLPSPPHPVAPRRTTDD